ATAWNVRWLARMPAANASISANASLYLHIRCLAGCGTQTRCFTGCSSSAQSGLHALSRKWNFPQSDACRIKNRIAQDCRRQSDGGLARAGSRRVSAIAQRDLDRRRFEVKIKTVVALPIG